MKYIKTYKLFESEWSVYKYSKEIRYACTYLTDNYETNYDDNRRVIYLSIKSKIDDIQFFIDCLERMIFSLDKNVECHIELYTNDNMYNHDIHEFIEHLKNLEELPKYIEEIQIVFHENNMYDNFEFDTLNESLNIRNHIKSKISKYEVQIQKINDDILKSKYEVIDEFNNKIENAILLLTDIYDCHITDRMSMLSTMYIISIDFDNTYNYRLVLSHKNKEEFLKTLKSVLMNLEDIDAEVEIYIFDDNDSKLDGGYLIDKKKLDLILNNDITKISIEIS